MKESHTENVYGNNVNSVVSAYTGTVAGMAERTTMVAEEYSRMILLEELRQK